ncbi:metallophosphoesterase [Niastella koreensis]|nr:metallophosphoesterase [Niastella koreensis]
MIVSDAPPTNQSSYYDYYKQQHIDFSDSLGIWVYKFDTTTLRNSESFIKEKIDNKQVKWLVNIGEPGLIRLPFLRQSIFINAGDSLRINFVNNQPVITGKGMESFNLQLSIFQYQNDILKHLSHYVKIKSVQDFTDWEKYSDDKLEFILRQLDLYKSKIPAVMYELIKNRAIKEVEFQRTEAYLVLNDYRVKNADCRLTVSDMKNIADSTLNKPWAKWLRNQADYIGDNETWYFYQYARVQVFNKVGWNWEADNFNTGAKRNLLYYQEIKTLYTGLLRERLLQFILAEEIIKDLGYLHPLTKVLLRDYYNQPGFRDYKLWMRNFEKTAAVKYNFKDEYEVIALDFRLKDINGNVYSIQNFRNKITLLNFWDNRYPSGCDSMALALQRVRQSFKGDTNVAFVNVFTDADKDKWLKAIKQKEKFELGILNLTTGSTNNDMLEDYGINSCPDVVLLGVSGEIAEHPVPDPRSDNGTSLINLIRTKLAQLNDGPYLFYKGDTLQMDYIIRSLPVTESSVKNKSITFQVSTDQYPNTFSVTLKSSLQNEPAIYPQPEKQLVLSDIEGNFDAFRKLLQANGVIDEQYNWTFGKGHLIFIGDMFDRGQQVTECLWLTYALEDKARAAGGYVHFILGNHEILNLSNDQRYVQEKYKHNIILLKLKYKDLFTGDTELGRWLRTKNIMEKIGDVLYLHAGVAREVNQLDLSLQQINDKVRPHLDNRDEFKTNNSQPQLMALFNGKTSPFWYRGYYKGRDQESIIDSTLRKFQVSHIITGHTIVADTISVHYGGKVINTDVHHAEGKSEALLIEHDRFFRLGRSGVIKELIANEQPITMQYTR